MLPCCIYPLKLDEIYRRRRARPGGFSNNTPTKIAAVRLTYLQGISDAPGLFIYFVCNESLRVSFRLPVAVDSRTQITAQQRLSYITSISICEPTRQNTRTVIVKTSDNNRRFMDDPFAKYEYFDTTFIDYRLYQKMFPF